MKIDKNKNAIDNVLALINDANKVNWTAEMVTVATPVAVTDGSHGGRNTRLTVTAVPGMGLRGSNTFYYNRLGMLDSVLSPQTAYDVDGQTNNATLFGTVVDALGLVASEVELVEPVVDQMPQITLQPKGISMLYNESTVLTLNWPSLGMTVDQLLTNDDLPGFVLPLFSLPALVTDTDLPGFEKVAKSQWMWKVDGTTTHAGEDTTTFTYLNDKLWYCDYEKLRAYSPIDGEVLFELDLRVRFGTPVGTNMYYQINAADANGVLWLLGSAQPGAKQIVRFDTNTMLVVDEFAPTPTDDSSDSYGLMSGNGTTDFVWARRAQRPSGGSFTYKLTRFDVTTGAATDFTLGVIPGSVMYDHVAKRVWVGYLGGGGLTRFVNVYELDGSNNPVLIKNFQVWDTATGQFSCAYDTPQGREVVLIDQDVDNDYAMYFRRYNALTGDWIADMRITTPDATIQPGTIGPDGLLKYNATTDEFYVSIYNDEGADFWAFKRTDVTQSRLVVSVNGSDWPWDYAMDVAGSRTFVLYETLAGTVNYLAQLRQP